jgi:hypothetical protein
LAGGDVVASFVKDGDHRLSRPQDLARLAAMIEELTAALATPPGNPDRPA